MGCTTKKAVFFHIPRTGGTWVEESLKRALLSEKMNCDVGWDIEINGIHIPPTKLKFNKFSFTFVRHPLDWYISYYQFLEAEKKSWNKFVKDTLGRYTWVVKQFEKVDFIGRTENLYFDLCKALDMAGEEYDEYKFHSQHINASMSQDIDFTDEQKEDILEAENYVIKKYYNS
jgi:hypothetical protein